MYLITVMFANTVTIVVGNGLISKIGSKNSIVKTFRQWLLNVVFKSQRPLTIFAKSSIFDVGPGPEYAWMHHKTLGFVFSGEINRVINYT